MIANYQSISSSLVIKTLLSLFPSSSQSPEAPPLVPEGVSSSSKAEPLTGVSAEGAELQPVPGVPL